MSKSILKGKKGGKKKERKKEYNTNNTHQDTTDMYSNTHVLNELA